MAGQAVASGERRFLFSGIIRDAGTLSPLSGSQIIVNRKYAAASADDGTFMLGVNIGDTVVFTMLGYRAETFYAIDSLRGSEFMAGIYLNADTLSIGEVIILPRMASLRSEMMKPAVSTTPEMENARYNVAVSAYQGRMAVNQLGDPSSNYAMIHRQNIINAFEKGGIPSDRIAGLSPVSLIGIVYILLNGFPEKPSPMKPTLTRQELEQIHKKYMEEQSVKDK
ncbi:MAG: hypothetical protein RBT38_03875 [Bacteroidales bacterium]|jgi:hypothetical protein|nr:hypothetical protein [Bacteroidales bacterium]